MTDREETVGSTNQWSASAFDGKPDDVRLRVEGPATTESMYLRTKEAFANGRIRLVYAFPVAPEPRA